MNKLACLLLIAGAALASEPEGVLETVSGDPALKTLSRAIEAAGLGPLLGGEGPLTLLAPTDDAFARVPDAEKLLQPAERARLLGILGFHVLEGRLDAGALREAGATKPLRGGRIVVAEEDGTLRVGGARLLRTVACRNGFVHVIDAVLVPPALAPEKKEFEVIVEADLPEGFPAPGPVGEVVLKEYPRYRAARATGFNPFGKLFRHIQKNEIEMTAPVEMRLSDVLAMKNMAFLYERPVQGAVGKDGDVEVLDLPAMKVLSLGVRGDLSRASIEGAVRTLERELAARGLRRAGETRTLGYNSPMVPASRRFWEVQIPVVPPPPGE